jgi:hypothetical protein
MVGVALLTYGRLTTAANEVLTVDGMTLREAAKQAGEVTGRRIVLNILPGHPAHKRQVTLTMPAGDADDVLTALAAAYGLRWIPGGDPGQVLLIDRQDYEGTRNGLLHAIGQALPASQRYILNPAATDTTRRMEAGLKQIVLTQSARMREATRNGPLAVGALPPDLAAPLTEYLDAFAVMRLGAAVGFYLRERDGRRASMVRYGPNDGGHTQFTFTVPNGSIGVMPSLR